MSFSVHERSRVDSKDEWLTPRWILNALSPFDLDPCAATLRPWDTARNHYSYQSDGLNQNWIGRVWLNPPYSEIELWMRKMARHGCGVALVFARTDTDWFQNHVFKAADALLFINKRIQFCTPAGVEAARGTAPSVLVAYGINNAGCLERCGIDGYFVRIKTERISRQQRLPV